MNYIIFMNKKEKILLILVIAALTVALYLIATSSPVNNTKQSAPDNQAGEEGQGIDLVKLEEDYEKEVKSIFADYLRLTAEADLDGARVKQIKNKLLALRTPTKFKDLHLNLVLAMVKMEDFFISGAAEEKVASQRLLSEIKANYIWIN